jgi:hypothetical protein
MNVRAMTHVLSIGGDQVGEGRKDSKGRIRLWLNPGISLNGFELRDRGLELELRMIAPIDTSLASPKAQKQGGSHRRAKRERS